MQKTTKTDPKPMTCSMAAGRIASQLCGQGEEFIETLPALWKQVEWPEDQLNDPLLSWSSTWKEYPVGCLGHGLGWVLVETARGSAAVPVPVGQCKMARRIMREAKRHGQSMAAVFASLEAIGGRITS